MSKLNRWNKDLLFSIPDVCSERARIFTESYKETEGLPAVMRLAKAFEKTLNEMTIYIQPQHLLVGNLASSPVASPIWPEFGVTWAEKELENLDKRPFEKYHASQEVKQELKGLYDYWKGKGREEVIVKRTLQVLPEDVRQAFDSEAYGLKPVMYAGYNKASGGAGHNVLNYEKALMIGFKGIIQEAEKALSALDYTDHDTVDKSMFLQAVITSLKAAIRLAHRYADLAQELAVKEKNPQRKQELERISEVCRWVPENPARSYWEGLQFTWFMQLLRWIESNGHSVSVGRLDQFLYPYYEKDLKEGRLTREEASELMENFFIKICEIKRLRPWTDTIYKGGYPLFQGITVGGQTPRGDCAVNELSNLILDVTGRLKLPEPVVTCRVFNGVPDEFLVKAVEALVQHGGGLPSFFSDDAIIQAMQNKGIPLEEARNYAVIPCPAPAVPGRHTDHTGGVCMLNGAKLLELALNGGVDPASGQCLCKENKDLSTFTSFDEVWEAYKRQLSYFMKFIPLFTTIASSLYAELNPTPFASALVDYRIEMGRDMNEGGGPTKDNSDAEQLHGVANMANALAAIKKLVFEEKRLSGEELKKALLMNFEGERNNEIRRMLLKVPKYGNDDDYVDSIAGKIAQDFDDEVQKLGTNWKGGTYGTTFQGVTSNVPEGAATGATADGRKAGEPLADNISPSAGTDINGVTAMLRSIAKLDHPRYRYGNILNVKFHPTAIKGSGVNKLTALIRTYLSDLKGWQLQFNVVSADTLKDAQQHPDKYKDLVVKVAGYCAQFIALDKRLQDQIIARTENTF